MQRAAVMSDRRWNSRLPLEWQNAAGMADRCCKAYLLSSNAILPSIKKNGMEHQEGLKHNPSHHFKHPL